MQDRAHVWEQLEILLSHAKGRVVLVAPFIKRSIFEAALHCVSTDVAEIRCITRWVPSEIAAGVSDPEIIQLAANDPRIQIHLCHALHAKLYIADELCLVGSANLTAKALGKTSDSNLEILIEASTSHPGVQRLLSTLEGMTSPATASLAEFMREQAEMVLPTTASSILGVQVTADLWTPSTREPARLYQFYRGSRGMPASIRKGVLSDLAYLDLPAGLSEERFNDAVQTRLRDIPGLLELLGQPRLSPEDLRQVIAGRGKSDEEVRVMTDTLAAWLAHFERFYRAYDRWELRQGRELK
ncbi:phospholipase D family protein [Allonocardiopsis opalescens]|uniref:Phospholipase D-like protein n=1 Tax=Allonocardiopsis opalescens TaxID=1144618 RepID=A0A2T0Q278_9ACTN|nr:phospholipase D-like protein [Allonocardiopsis opalescens]